MALLKWIFIVFCVYVGSLFFREETIPGSVVESLSRHFLSTNVVLHVDSFSYGFRSGVRARGIRLYALGQKDALRPVISAASLEYNPFTRHLLVNELCYPRLPDGYYEEGNQERNERLDFTFPKLGKIDVTLIRPNILSLKPERVTCKVKVSSRRIDISRFALQWPASEECRGINGYCYFDIDRQEVYGDVEGHATQMLIRPFLVMMDIPSSLVYVDAFTDVPKSCPARCRWKVDLVNNDFDLWLDLSPTLGKYLGVPMRSAEGTIHVHNYTRGTFLNYVTTVGPITAKDNEGRHLDGKVVIAGLNGTNTVNVTASSAQPLADLLKIGGFEGDYLDREVIGESTCDLLFNFPRSMTNNYEVLNGSGHVEVKSGYLMRMRWFEGLIDAMPSVAPAVSWFSDSTQASCDYVITNGILKTDNIYIEGTCFSIKMFGTFNAMKESLDFTVRVQFAKKDSFVGKVLHPLAWPFTKLLLEFKLTGSASNPKWSYVSVLDRVVEAVK